MKKILFIFCFLLITLSNFAQSSTYYQIKNDTIRIKKTVKPTIGNVLVCIDTFGDYVTAPFTASAWGLNGNSGTTGANFLGPTSNDSLVFRILGCGGGCPRSLAGFVDDHNSSTAFGESALNSQTTGVNNSGFGINSLSSITTGSYNVGLGTGLQYTTTGSYNIAVGYNSAVNNITGSRITCIGNASGVTTDGLSDAMAFGERALVGCSHCGVFGDSSEVHYWGIGTGTPNNYFTDAYQSGLVLFHTQFALIDSSQGAGKVLVSNANGLATWSNLGGIIVLDSVAVASGPNPQPAVNSNMIVISSGQLSSGCVLTMPAGVTGNYLNFQIPGGSNAFSYSGANTGTIRAEKATMIKAGQPVTFYNVNGNWY
jgi:hypothetical protein